MPRYADPFTCPGCGSRLPVDVTGCPTCRINLRSPLAAQLLETLQTADDLLARLRSETATQPVVVAVQRTPYPARAVRPRSRGLSGASVPRILLSLGALCLLVAAVIFLAVTWTWLGVGGRTAVLVGLTLVTGGAGVALGRRELRVAAEALTSVSLGLLTLDVIGADRAGWLGDLGDGALITATSATVLVAALALSATTRLVAPQLVAALAVSGVGLGVLAMTERWQPVAASVALAYGVLAVLARPAWLVVLRFTTIVTGSWWWGCFALSGLVEAVDHATWRGLWLDGHGYPLLVATLMVPLPLLVIRSNAGLLRGLLTATAALLTITVAVPAFDESPTTLAVAGLAVLGAWTTVAVLASRQWRIVALPSMALGAAPVVGVVGVLAAQAAVNALGTAAPFAGTIGMRLPDPDPVAAPALLAIGVAALVAAVLALVRRTTTRVLTGAVLVAAALVGTVALFPAPLWVLVSAAAALGSALVADALRRTDKVGPVEASTGAAVLLASTVVALPSAGLTALVSAVVLLAACAVRWCATFAGAEQAGGLALPFAGALLVWSALAAFDVPVDSRGLPVLLVVGLLAVVVAEPVLEIGAAVTAFLAVTGSVEAAGDQPTSLAVHLTVAGALVTASALVHPSRRVLGWPGGALLALATWVRLADLGVEAPEAYTLPTATALLVLGLVQLRRDPSLPTARALAPGLVLATVPSLLWVLVDPTSPRAVLLGAGCLMLVLLGVRLRWSAPLLVGSAVGGLLVLRELAPYAAAVPQWVLIGIAGTLLTVVGITWESRLRDLGTSAGYLRRLR